MTKRYRTKNNVSKVLEFLLTEKADLARTNTTKFSDEKQIELETKLGRIADQIKTMKKKGIDDMDIKDKFEIQVKSLISDYVEDTYLNGRKYAIKTNKIRTPLEVEDIQNMNEMKQNFEARFWGLVNNAEVKEFAIDVLGSFVRTMVSDLVTKSTNMAALTTMNQQSRLAQAILATQSIRGSFVDLEEITLEFTTRKDERVCPICSPLDGKRFDFDDPSKPDIPVHPNCRCRYLEVKNGKAISG